MGPVALERIANHDVENDNKEDPRLTVDWEMQADAESNTIRLFVPGTNRQCSRRSLGVTLRLPSRT